MKSKTVLMIISVLLILMGAAALVPSWETMTGPMWHAIVTIVLGVFGLGTAMMDKPAKSMMPPQA